jgi:hypothetical protein
MRIVSPTGKKLRFNDKMVVTDLPEPPFIDGYTKLKAVKMVNCYVDTGIKPLISDSIECVFQDYGLTNSPLRYDFNCLFGSRTGSFYSDNYFLFSKFNDSRQFYYARRGAETRLYSSVPNKVLKIVISNNTDNYKATLYDNETSLQIATVTPPNNSVSNCSWNMWVGCGNNSNNVDVYCNADFYSFKIYDSEGNLKVDLVPVRRNSDNVCGFYDLAQKVFRTNLGSGTITGIDF